MDTCEHTYIYASHMCLLFDVSRYMFLFLRLT